MALHAALNPALIGMLGARVHQLCGAGNMAELGAGRCAMDIKDTRVGSLVLNLDFRNAGRTSNGAVP